MGALPPSGMEWQVGKRPECIKAVKVIERMLKMHHYEREHLILKTFQETIKAGKFIYHYFPSEQNILDSLLLITNLLNTKF